MVHPGGNGIEDEKQESADLELLASLRNVACQFGDQASGRVRFDIRKVDPARVDEIVERTKQILKFSGEGHSASIHSEMTERHLKLAEQLNVGRVNCNMPHAAANSGSWFNGQYTTDTLGCGTWAGNMTSENINWRHFLNYTRLSVPIPEHIPTDEDLFGEYLAKWGRD